MDKNPLDYIQNVCNLVRKELQNEVEANGAEIFKVKKYCGTAIDPIVLLNAKIIEAFEGFFLSNSAEETEAKLIKLLLLKQAVRLYLEDQKTTEESLKKVKTAIAKKQNLRRFSPESIGVDSSLENERVAKVICCGEDGSDLYDMHDDCYKAQSPSVPAEEMDQFIKKELTEMDVTKVVPKKRKRRTKNEMLENLPTVATSEAEAEVLNPMDYNPFNELDKKPTMTIDEFLKSEKIVALSKEDDEPSI
jgi:hypothetical protein